jgi:hypothetical protein
MVSEYMQRFAVDYDFRSRMDRSLGRKKRLQTKHKH